MECFDPLNKSSKGLVEKIQGYIWLTPLSLFVKLPLEVHVKGYFFLFKKKFFLHLFIFERQSTNGGGAEREGDTESEAGSRPRAVSTEPDVGTQTHEPRDHALRPSRRLTN